MLAVFAGDTVSLTVTPQNASVVGKWDNLSGQQKESRYISVYAGGDVKLGSDGHVVGTPEGADVTINPNDSSHCYADCELKPESPQHRVHISGTYTTKGTGTGGKGTWAATGYTDKCTYSNLKTENKEDAQDGTTWTHDPEITPHKFNVTCTKDKIFEEVREKAAWINTKGKSVWGMFYENNVSGNKTEVKYVSGLECPVCKGKTLYRYQITPKSTIDFTSSIEIAYWNEYYAGGASGPGPEARLAWREFRTHIEWHENYHKSDFSGEKYLDKVKELCKEFNAKIFIGEACSNAFSSPGEAKKKAWELAEKEYNDKFQDLKGKLDELDTDLGKIFDAFDKSDTVIPGEGSAPLKTIGDPEIIEGLGTIKRWEEMIERSFAKEKGYQYYLNQRTKNTWILIEAPTWLHIDQEGKLSGTPSPDAKPKGYKSDGNFKLTVKYEETLDGETISGELNYTLVVKSWLPVIKNISYNSIGCVFTVEENTGIPKSKNPSYSWKDNTKGIRTKESGGKTNTFTIVINDRNKTWVPIQKTTRNYIQATLNQKSGNVTVPASSAQYYYENKK